MEMSVFLQKMLAALAFLPCNLIISAFEQLDELSMKQILTLLHHLKPSPDTVFRHLRPDRGGGGSWCDPLGVSTRSVAELHGKDQQIALAEYSRLVVLRLALGQCLTQLWQVKGQIFRNSMIFQLYESISAKLSMVAA